MVRQRRPRTSSSRAREPTRSDGKQRRREILDAALKCFARDGVLGAGIEDIRKEAGASPSSVYRLFGDIEGIMLAMLVEIFDELFAHLAARVVRTRTAEGAVHALVDGHIEWIAAHAAAGRFMYQAMTLEAGRGLRADQRRRLVAAKATALRPVLEHIAPFIASGAIPPWSPALLDVVLLGVAHEALRRWLAGAGDELAPERLRALLPALAWKSVHRRERGARLRASTGRRRRGCRRGSRATRDRT